MDFRIADTFTDSLARLTGDEQKAVKTTAFDLQLNPANPGMDFHKLAKAKDKNFWSLRVSADTRLIVHKSEGNLLLCYVNHHDKAFLHPEQRQWVERDYSGPARVSGSAGTGKTIVALHRAAHLARTHPNARVLLTTFSDTLGNALHTKLKRLVGSEPRLAERIDVHSLNALGLRIYKSHCGPVNLASNQIVRELLCEASKGVAGHKFSLYFLLTDYNEESFFVRHAYFLGANDP